MLRIGIAGGGYMGRKHAQVIAASRRATLTGVADPVSPALAEELGVPAHPDIDALISHGNIDGVIIASPNDLHVPNALAALRAGIPTLVEKPVSVTVADGELLALESARSGIPVLVGHHRRHHPVTAAAHRAITGGLLGEIVTASGLWVTRKPDEYFAQAWRCEPGAGVLLVNAVHELDLLRHLVGEAEEVVALTSHRRRGFAVKDTLALSLRFTGGALGSFTASDAAVSPWTWDQGTTDDDAWPYDPEARSLFLSGTHASLSLPEVRVHGLRGDGLAPTWNDTLDHLSLPVEPGNAFERQLAHFLDVVAGGARPRVTVDDALGTLRLALAVQEAARTGRPVRLRDGIAAAGSGSESRPGPGSTQNAGSARCAGSGPVSGSGSAPAAA